MRMINKIDRIVQHCAFGSLGLGLLCVVPAVILHSETLAKVAAFGIFQGFMLAIVGAMLSLFSHEDE